MANEQDHVSKQGALQIRTTSNVPSPALPAMASEEEVVADGDEPPESGRTPRPAVLQLHYSSITSFTKSKPRFDRQQSLLTTALQASSAANSPVEEQSDKSPVRGMSTVSTWSNNSVTTADLTSDGGMTSPVSRTSTPSPPPPSSAFHSMIPLFNKKPFEQPVSVVSHDDESVGPLQQAIAQPAGEQKVEAVLGRKRCIMFACGKKEEKKPAVEAPKPEPKPQKIEPPKRVCTIKFACPSKISVDTSALPTRPRVRMVSPAPSARRIPSSPKPKVHRDSDSTVRNSSPVSVRKAPVIDRARRLSLNSDLARCDAYRFHEFASSEEEVEDWTQVSTCHRNRLTVSDTLKVENGLRQLGEEVEEEALEEDEDEDEVNEVDDDDLLEEDEDNSDAYSDATDEGFQTDDEDGFAVSDDESDAGSDYNWWAPGASTAATSVEHLEQLRLKTTRTVSESSVGSLESQKGFEFPAKLHSKRRKPSRPVNIRVPSPELPDSTDFVCGTLDEDRPLEQAYMSTLERRRAAKHKPTPQDIDPTFPTSDPELLEDEEDEVSEVENLVSESDNYFMLHGRMDHIDGDPRGRRRDAPKKRSPAQSPKRFRSPPPMKRTMYRSPPPRKLFGASPRRLHSPPLPMRLRSPPPTRRGSTMPIATQQRNEMAIRFGGIGERPVLVTSASVPRTPLTPGPNPLEYDDEDVNVNDIPVRRAIDIQVGLEKRRQRRKDQLYRKQHRKPAKEKRPAPGRGAERMREMGLAAHAHKGKIVAFNPFQMPATPDQKDMHVLSV
ncbi:hypothetical protein CC86DRAFT_298541 [Ophiobolus disseminans]|uniref:Uncharacterized protein n=1 Tax=Ophiobolus disseminans TaxID=1469910 RepID=A0A6A6ZRH6_9PLEO|nr:hypothetical protein CC86DRAFT_298541 [Ophiobolus disseminans]